ncbi:helix-turn-helix domain-containing protein [Nocardiopsis trehalosi]|uniref:helix-turn-helix domain-containing protein n=1 Tax=Nocardiopsis trehalosi TaxID=109329 RepID=UPI00082A8347|nr:helix-turn-helix transcriptional regulator [Nocardiopsis trehalosi]
MDRADELRAFLRSRRARLSPDDVGVWPVGGRRRVPGLRREEVADLAGVSPDYYVRLEQGRNGNVSTDVLDAVSRALRLSDIEREHLHNLARPLRRGHLTPAAEHASPGVQAVVDGMAPAPAYVVGRHTQLLAWNHPARTVFADFDALPRARRNMARLVFLDPDAQRLYLDWEHKAGDVIARLRFMLGRHPHDPALTGLVAELADARPEFRRLWDTQVVADKTHGAYRLRHPSGAAYTLPFRALRLPEDPDQTLIAYTPDPGSDAEAMLRSATGGTTAHRTAAP